MGRSGSIIRRFGSDHPIFVRNVAVGSARHLCSEVERRHARPCSTCRRQGSCRAARPRAHEICAPAGQDRSIIPTHDIRPIAMPLRVSEISDRRRMDDGRPLRCARDRQRRGWQVPGLAPGQGRAAGRGGRAPLDRRLLPQHQLPAEQERDLERRDRPSRPARRSVRHRDRPGRGGHGPGGRAQAGDGPRPRRHAPRPLPRQRRGAHHGNGRLHGSQGAHGRAERGRVARADGRANLPQPRHAPDHSRRPGPARRGTADEYRGARTRRRARPPRRPRRRLRGPRTGPGLPPVRQRGDGDRARGADRGPRGSGRGLRARAAPRGRGVGHPHRHGGRARERPFGRRRGDHGARRRRRGGHRRKPHPRRGGPGAEHRRDRPRPRGGGPHRAGRDQGRRPSADERAGRLGHRRVRGQPGLHPRLRGRFPRDPRRSRGDPALDRGAADARLPVHGPAAGAGRIDRGRGARPRRCRPGRQAADGGRAAHADDRADRGLHEGRHRTGRSDPRLHDARRGGR